MKDELYQLAGQLGYVLKSENALIATAESCTGGWIAQAITDIPGSSAWFDRGFITYSNAAKLEMLGVKRATLDDFGAVSQETVTEMLRGAMQQSCADRVIAVSGIAGPAGGSVDKPVGTVYIGWMQKYGQPVLQHQLFSGNRREIRKKAVRCALHQGIEFFGG